MKRVIVLDRLPNEGGTMGFQVCFWLDVAAARQKFLADPASASAYADATAEELAAIRAGQVVEQVGEVRFVQGTTIALIQQRLDEEQQRRQAALDAEQRWQRYGTYLDETGWHAAGVA